VGFGHFIEKTHMLEDGREEPKRAMDWSPDGAAALGEGSGERGDEVRL
jgi:hypothetical protein